MGSHYCHLKLDEHRKLAKWLEAKTPVSEIADRLGRDPSTIYRDIKRNRYTDEDLPELNGYHAVVAQDKYEERRAIHRKMIVHPKLKEAIEDRLKAGWSPEQIAGRLRLKRYPIRVSHETIYQFAYSKDGRDEQFYRHLPEHRKRRRPRGYGNCRITATAQPRVWKVQFYNSMDTLILDTYEVTEMPEVALAATEDLTDSAARIRTVIEAIR